MLNLEEFMFNEFLRPRENICKWFNELWVVWRGVYIGGVKRHNFRTILTEWIDSLNIQIDSYTKKEGLEGRTGYEDWCESGQHWNDLNCPDERFESIQSECESIQRKSES